VTAAALRLSGNRLEGCWQGGAMWQPGALVLGGGSEVSITDNVVVRNGTTAVQSGFHAIYAEDLSSLQFTGNLVDENGRDGTPSTTGAVLLRSVQIDARIQGNSIRRNGGTALAVEAPGPPESQGVGTSVMVQDNYFEGRGVQDYPIVYVTGVRRVHYQDNVSWQEMSSGILAYAAASVLLRPLHAVVTGNTVDVNRPGYSRLAVQATPPGAQARAIVTSNLIKGPLVPSGYVAGGLVAIHNLALP
jgi:hypothetical protein